MRGHSAPEINAGCEHHGIGNLEHPDGVYNAMHVTAGCYGLACLSVLMLARSYASIATPLPASAIPVVLPSACSDEDLLSLMNGHGLVLHYGLARTSSVYGEALDISSVPRDVQQSMSLRNDRELWITADKRLSFGEVLGDISALWKENKDVTLRLLDWDADYHLYPPKTSGALWNRDFACTPPPPPEREY